MDKPLGYTPTARAAQLVGYTAASKGGWEKGASPPAQLLHPPWGYATLTPQPGHVKCRDAKDIWRKLSLTLGWFTAFC